MPVHEVTSEHLTRLLELIAEADGGRPALVDRTDVLTYAELEAQSNRVAHLLAELGVARSDRVGLYMEKSVDAVAGLYGALKAGAACVPLDPLAPADRIAQIARDCELRVLLTGVEKRGQ